MAEITAAWNDRVSAYLEQILGSAEFKKSERLRKFLSYVVRETLAGANVIRSYNIAVEVFGKGEGFDPADPYVRNIARHVRLALKKYYSATGIDDDICISVPAGNYIAVFSLTDATDEVSVASPSEVTEAFLFQHAANETVKTHDSRASRMAISSNPTIAVIPFDYHGAASDEEAIIGEMLAGSAIAGLSRSSHFNVISRLSTSKLRDSKWSLEQIARKLSADYVVSGSYSCRNGRLFLMVELADCVTSEIVWADELRCIITDLLHEQDSLIDTLISQTACSIIRQEVSRASSQPLDSLALHTKLVMGLHDMHLDSTKRFYSAKSCLEQILLSHPTHTMVNAQLAHWYVLMLNRSGGWTQEIENKKVAANRYLQRALKTDPTNSLALTMSGLLETQLNRNPEKGLETYQLAEKNNPNEALVYCYKAAVLSYIGEGAAAIESAEKALRLSPFDPQLNMFHTCAAAAYYAVNDYSNAEKHAKRADLLNPKHSSNLRTLVAIQMDLGKTKEAEHSAKRLLQYDPKFTIRGYLSRSPNASYNSGRLIADRLERAGVPV